MTEARYDEVADWYDDWIGDEAAEGSLAVLTARSLGGVRGRRVLDLACGNGVVARYLAREGAIVEGVDLSPKLIAKASELETNERRGIRYHLGNAADTTWWDGTTFDAVVCNTGLSDIDDLDGAMNTIRTVLRPAGVAAFSLMHPCFPGHGNGLSSWPPDAGYFVEGWWTTGGEGCRGRVGAYHRTMSTYINAAVAHGLTIEHMIEPPFPGSEPPGVPSLLIIACSRGA